MPTCGSRERKEGKMPSKVPDRQQEDAHWRKEYIEPVQGLVVLGDDLNDVDEGTINNAHFRNVLCSCYQRHYVFVEILWPSHRDLPSESCYRRSWLCNGI